MKKGFTTFLSALKANTPPCKKGLSSLRFLSIFLILFLAVGNVWAQEETLFEADFSDAVWSGATFSQGNTSTPDVINGITFYSKNSSKQFSLSSGVLTWPDNNMSSSNYFLGFPITGINDGKITISVYNGSTNTRVKYLIKDGEETFTTSLGTSGTATSSASPTTATVTELEGEKAFVYLGRQGSGLKTITKIVVTTPAPAATYSVTYELNGGTGTAPTQEHVAEGTKITLASADGITPPTGQEFNGWKCSVDNVTYAAGAEYTMTAAATTFTAQWRAETTKYEVTYDLNGAEGTAPTQEATAEGDKIILADAPAWTGYQFDGWKCSVDNVTYAAGAEYTMTAAATTFTAQWTKVWTVTFDTNGGSAIDPVVVVNNGSVTAPTAPTKDCYAFGEWQKEGVAYDFTTAITSDITLTATWTAKYASSFNFGTATSLTKDNIVETLNAVNIAVAVGTGGSYDAGATTGYLGYKFKNKGDKVSFLLQQGYRATITYGYTESGWTVNGSDAGVATATKAYVDKVYQATSSDVLYTLINQSADSKTSVISNIVIEEIPEISDDATLYDLKVNGTTIDGFNSATKIYYLTVPYGTEVANMPKITEATANHPSAAAVIYPEAGPEWTEEYGGCYLQQVVVTAEDGTTKGYYHVRTTVDAKQGVSLIKATHDGTETGATVTGYIGGTVDKKTQGGGKLGSNGHYFGIKLAAGTFLAGDIVTIYASTPSSKVQIFSDKGETMINDSVFNGDYYTYTLTEATEWIYLYRTSDGGSSMNPTLGYIEVQRYMNPFIESFVIGEAEGTIDQENKTITVEVPASTDVTALTPTIVAWANGGATVTPTDAQDFTNPVVYNVASAYTEDETVSYTVTVKQLQPSAEPTINTQPQSKSYIEDATIEALTIEVTAEGTLTYQWQQKNGDNWEDIAEATSASYIPTVSAIGSYIYRCVVTHVETDKVPTSINSNEATISIIMDPNCGTFVTIPTESPYNYTATGLWTIYNANSSGKRDDGNTFSTGKDYADNTVNIFGKQRCVLIFEKDVKQVTFYTNNSSTGRNWAGSDPVTVSDDKDNFLGTETPDYTAMDATTSIVEESDYKITLTAEGNFEAGKVYLFNFSNSVKIFRICVVDADPKAEVPVFTGAGLVDEDICEGNTFTTLDATASPVTDYVWYKDGVVIEGATAATYTPTEGGKYYCIATNAPDGFRAMSVQTTEVTLASFASAEILSAPENVRMNAGETATLAVVATGKNVTYQWYTCDDEAGSNPVIIEGADEATYEVIVTVGMSQYYKVVVSSDCGSPVDAVVKVEEWTELPQADVTESITWDWTKAASVDEIKLTEETTPAKNEGIVMANGGSTIYNNEDFESDKLYIEGEYIVRYGKYFQGQTIKFKTTVEGLVRVTFSNTGGNPARELYVNNVGTGVSSASATMITTGYVEVPAGEVSITAYLQDKTEDAKQKYVRVSKIEFLALGYTRDVNVGELATVCLPNACVARDVEVYELVGKEPQYGKIVFDEILSGELMAGKPYLLRVTNPKAKFYYTVDAPAAEPNNSGAMKGTFVDMTLTDLTNIYYFAQKALWSCVDLTSLSVPANRAYVNMAEMPDASTSNPAPGVRRVTLGVNGQNVTTGMENIDAAAQPTKMIIDGQLYILRGEKMYDATGKLVK